MKIYKLSEQKSRKNNCQCDLEGLRLDLNKLRDEFNHMLNVSKKIKADTYEDVARLIVLDKIEKILRNRIANFK